MLVKVKETFRGTFGQFDEELHTVRARKAGDDPFEVPDSVAKAQIAAGVLERAEEDQMPFPMVPPEEPEEVAEEELVEEPVKKPAKSRKGKKKSVEELPVISAADPE